MVEGVFSNEIDFTDTGDDQISKASLQGAKPAYREGHRDRGRPPICGVPPLTTYSRPI